MLPQQHVKHLGHSAESGRRVVNRSSMQNIPVILLYTVLPQQHVKHLGHSAKSGHRVNRVNRSSMSNISVILPKVDTALLQ